MQVLYLFGSPFFLFVGSFVISLESPKLLINVLRKIKTHVSGKTTANMTKIASIK